MRILLLASAFAEIVGFGPAEPGRRRRLLTRVTACALLLCTLPATAYDSLADQLQQAGARPGTALARLITDNQDFSLLRPDEAGDTLPYPPWLRVYWRKGHPEGAYDAGDPSGGYPRVLGNILAWMRTHQDLVPGPGVGTEPPAASTAPVKTSVGANLRISGASSAPQSESDIRINFTDRTKIVAASNNIVGSGAQSQYSSTDGGSTWSRTTLPIQTGLGDAFHSDPTVDWTSDGTAWSTTLGINSGASVVKGRAYKSVDNGANWTFDATFSGTQTAIDKQIMWVDHSPTSAFFNNIYVIWQTGAAFVGRRTGGGWQTPVQVSGAESTGTAIGGDVRANSAGDVFAFWPTTGNRRVFVAKSTTGGASFAAPVQIATTFDSFDIGVPSFNSRRALIYVSGSAYKTATRNEVYASWVDLTGAAGCTSPANEPGSSAASTCKTRVWFSRSVDGGALWSAPVMLNNQSGLNDQYNQWLTVDETNGMLGIMYYDTVADPSRLKTDVWYQSSFDGGATWSTAIKVTTAQTDETSAGADSGNQYGDYNGLTASAGLVFPSWTDRRSGAKEEIWTALIDERVTVTAAGAGTGSGGMNGAGLACNWNGVAVSGTCTAKVPQLATASIVAAPTGGATFISWTGCASTTTTTIAGDTCKISPNANLTITANFGNSPTVTVSAANLAASATGMTIAGTGFSSTPGNNTVTFNDGAVGAVTAATTTQLTIAFSTKPVSAGSLTAVVTVNAVSSGAAVQVATVTPVVTSSAANLAANSTTMTINGFGFSATPANNTVAFVGGATGTVTGATPTQLTLGSLSGLGAGALNAAVTSNSVGSGAAVQVATVVPVITVSTANLAANATSLVINGFGFSATPANNTVVLTGGTAGTVTAASVTQLTINVSGLTTGSLTATVAVGGATSASAQVATVTSPIVTANTVNVAVSAVSMVINGFGYSTTPTNNVVTFSGGITGTRTVTAATANSLTVTLSGQVTGALNAVVVTNGQSSGAAVRVATIVATLPRITPTIYLLLD